MAELLAKFGGRAIVVAVALSAAACGGGPTAPTVDPVEAFAAAHAHEVCILATKTTADGAYVNYGVLIPLATYATSGGVAMPISYCNPAE